MPIYEYECENCEHKFEIRQSINAGSLRKCKECGEFKLKKQISQSSFVLKGNCWESDGYS